MNQTNRSKFGRSTFSSFLELAHDQIYSTAASSVTAGKVNCATALLRRRPSPLSAATSRNVGRAMTNHVCRETNAKADPR